MPIVKKEFCFIRWARCVTRAVYSMPDLCEIDLAASGRLLPPSLAPSLLRVP